MKNCKNCEPNSGSEGFCPECLALIEKIGFEELDKERKWDEELFMGRLNNFLVVFSLMVTAGFITASAVWQAFIFFFGAIFLFFYWQTAIIRMYHKYDSLLKIMFSTPELKGKVNELYYMNKFQMKRKNFKAGLRQIPVSKWLAKWLPLMCILFLFCAGIFSILSYFSISIFC